MNIPRDKLMHIAAGAITAAMVAGAIGVGVGYEALQYIRKEGEPALLDAVATAIGGAVLAAAFFLARQAAII